MPSLKAIIFDLDDTLYPERVFVDSGFAAVARWASRKLGVDGSEVLRSLKQLLNDGVRGNLFNVWLEQQGRNSQLVDVMVSVYRDHAPSIRLHPGAAEVLDLLRTKYRLGLLSDGYLETQRNKFRALALDGHFCAVVFSDEFGRSRWKPHPAPFEAVLRELDVVAGDAIYVGDNPAKDFIGARAVGMRSIRIRYPDGVYADDVPATRAHEPDEQVADLRELPELVEDIYSHLH